jgi:hypothetical protein
LHGTFSIPHSLFAWRSNKHLIWFFFFCCCFSSSKNERLSSQKPSSSQRFKAKLCCFSSHLADQCTCHHSSTDSYHSRDHPPSQPPLAPPERIAELLREQRTWLQTHICCRWSLRDIYIRTCQCLKSQTDRERNTEKQTKEHSETTIEQKAARKRRKANQRKEEESIHKSKARQKGKTEERKCKAQKEWIKE